MSESGAAKIRIGIDIGGSKIAALIIDGPGQKEAHCRSKITRDYDDTVDKIYKIVLQLEAQAGPADKIGISMPGIISRNGEPLVMSNLPWLRGKPFRFDLEQRFKRPVRLGNDANCFALSEATDGAAAGARLVFGVILGTGVGGAIVVNGNIVTGANSSAGEWGHNLLPWRHGDEGVVIECGCGQIGCIETWLNGAALSREYASLSGKEATAKDISDFSDAGDEVAQQVIACYTERLARALATAINFLDPDVIVLGGGLSEIASLYEQVPKLWRAHTSSDASATRLVKAAYGPESGMRGAAWL